MSSDVVPTDEVASTLADPCSMDGPVVVEDEGSNHMDQIQPDEVEAGGIFADSVAESLHLEAEPTPSLPIVQESKRARMDPSVPLEKDKIKWVGSIPFVQSSRTGLIHSGKSVMCKVSHPGYTSVACCDDCCVFKGQAYGGLCECLCHILAADYSSR